MKSLKYLSILIAGLLVFTACEDSQGPVLNSDVEPPVIESPDSGTSYVLTEDDEEEELMTIEWSTPDFGFSAAVDYRVQLSVDGSFDDAVRVGDSNSSSLSPTVGSVNSALITAGLPSGVETEVSLRVRATLSDSNEDPLYSDPIMLGFTPYAQDLDLPEIYAIGNFLEPGGYGNDWDWDSAVALFGFDSETEYSGFLYFDADGLEYKFAPERSWDLDWGDDDADGNLDEGGSNITMEDAGFYRFSVNTENLTYSFERKVFGLIGEAAGGWDDGDDVIMEYDTEENVWVVEADLVAGEMKFRANQEWNLNYGDDDGNGTLQEGGANIMVDADGTYRVTLDLNGPVYTYSLELL
ncbi:MAG: SusE domain-containing protein [Balneolaceae bacterium]|nr:SusE domain-containing protein [Balneolaceae bacterium]MCH8548628.1 SusE domain-containing protein [Balneolaceae bacterium]